MQTVVHRDWVNQVTTMFTLSPGITISYAFWQSDGTGHVSSTEVELWTVALKNGV